MKQVMRSAYNIIRKNDLFVTFVDTLQNKLQKETSHETVLNSIVSNWSKKSYQDYWLQKCFVNFGKYI